ncbi:hypothetical protein YWIDRAFT_06167 [Streptomyces sp. SceaMP-e96]|nr:hypothetical protein YWIDRAFT_06167 [Streptomyces sp. SceaMP-e96]
MVIPASPSSRSRTRYRGALQAHVAAVCCGLLLSGAAVATAAAAPTDHAQAQTQVEERGRGTLVSAEKLYARETPQAVAAELGDAGFEADTVRYGVVAYRLVYRTVDPYGRPTTASGLFVPLNREGRLRAVSFAHGTGSHKDHSSSMQRSAFVSAPVIAHAAAGAMGVAPDCLGMGKGPLFDGAHTGEQLKRGTPGTLNELLTEHGRELLAHPTGPLAAALRTTGAVCAGWVPGAPVRLYMPTGDPHRTPRRIRLPGLQPHCSDASTDEPVEPAQALDTWKGENGPLTQKSPAP